MVQRVEAWGNVLEFPDGMSDDDMAAAIRKNEVHLNPNASTFTKAKAFASDTVDAGLSMLTPKKSIAEQAEERSRAESKLAPIEGVPVRRDFYNKTVAETSAASDSTPAKPLVPGNIDLNKRPVVRNKDGSISTVRSLGFNDGEHEVLIPTVSNDGRILSDDEAIKNYFKTGRHLGKFATPEESTAFAERLHDDQDRQYSTGVVSRVRNAAAQDKKAQNAKQTVARAIASTEPDEGIGLLGTLAEGSKGTARNLRAAAETLDGNEAGVISAAREAEFAEKDPALSALLADIEQRKKALGDNPGWIDAIKTVGSAALSNPKGAGLLLAEQLPNSAAALAAGGAGAIAGSAFGPAGTIAGGLAGLFGANTALETGGKAIEAATDGTFSPEEQSRVLKEGAIKGGVITGIDAATLGLTNFITGTTRRAVERATAKVLADHGVDVTNKAAVTAAAKNPAIAESVKAAQELAAKASTTLGQRVARVGGATGLETVGEGAGEYLGEMAATGKADKVDAAVEALAGAGMSAGEITITAARNKAKLETILGKPVTEVSDKVLRYTAARGGERAKAAAQAELNRRATEGVDPEIANAPESTSDAVDRIIATGREKADEIRSARADAIQDDIFDEEPENEAGNAPVAQSQPLQDTPTPEPIQTLNAQINALAEGRKPGVLLTPNEPMPDTLPEGVQAAEIPGRGILLYRDEAALRDALDGRMGEALGYGIDEKPADATQVVTARNPNGTVIQDVATDGRPEVEQAAAAVAGPGGTVETRSVQDVMAERGANAKQNPSNGFEKFHPASGTLGIPRSEMPQVPTQSHGGLVNHLNAQGIAHKTKMVSTNKLKPTQAEFSPEKVKKAKKSTSDRAVIVSNDGHIIDGHHQALAAHEEGRPVKAIVLDAPVDKALEAVRNSPSAQSLENDQAAHPIRPLVESLIKRRAAAKQSGKERSINNAIARAKEVLEGKRTDAALESKWFRVQAAGIQKADPATAEILKQIGDRVNGGKLESRTHRTMFERYASLGTKNVSAEQSLIDAEDITGLRIGLTVEYADLPEHVPARFDPSRRIIEVSNKREGFRRGYGALIMAEELLHAVDALSSDRTLSASSKRLNLQTGDIAMEVIAHADSKGAYGPFFYYPLGYSDLTDTVKEAELFARLGVLYFGEPERMRQSLPLAYGAFNEIFSLAIHPVSGELSKNVWSFTGGASAHGGKHRTNGRTGAGNGKSAEGGQRTELGRLRAAIWKSFKADPLGGEVDFRRLDTRSFKTRLQAYKEKNAKKPFKERLQTYKERQNDDNGNADELRNRAAKAKSDSSARRLSKSVQRDKSSDKVLKDDDPKFSKERIASVRKRLKTASDKKKQATRRGGLSVSEVEKLIAPLQQAGFKKINIAATQNDLPQKIRDQIKSQKAGAVRGAYIPSTDEIWLVADQLNDALDVALVAMHEARHRGLRKMFGPGIAPIMRQIYATNKRVRDLADRKIKTGMSKELAVEETLADMPLDRARALNGWKKLIRFIKQWLAEKLDLTFTDAMVEQLVAGAEIVGMSEDEVSLFDESKAEAIRDASNGTMFSRKPSHNNDSEFSEAADKAIKESADKNRRFREEHITLWDKSKKWLKRQLSPGGLLPQSVFAEKISRDNEFAAIEFDIAHLVGKLEKAIKADYGISAINLDAKVQTLLSEVMAGKIDKDVPEITKTALIGMRQYIDSLSMRYVESLREQAIEQVAMAELTGDKDLIAKAEENARLQVTIMGNIGEYVHRSYRAFDDPNWAKKIPDQVINDARDYLIERNLETMGKAEAERKAEIILNEIVKHGTAYDSMAAFIRESKLGAKDLSILQRRKVIAPEIRALLGEYTDPRINFAKSATKMGRLIFNQKFLENIRKAGFGEFMFTNENKPAEATAKIAADSSEILAPLNGLWVTPEVDQAFRDALGKEHMEDWYRKIVQINGMVKYGKTVLSPTTAARNWMSAFFFAVANGHFDLRHMAKSVDGLKEYFAHGGDARKMAYLRELKQLGVVYDTPYAGEMMRLLADTNIADTLILGKKKLNIKNAFAMATKFYQYGDDFWKIIGFENEKQMWMKAGLSEQEAKVKAAERIRNTYPTYSMVGRGIQALRRFPLAGTFVSFPAEIVRTSANMLKYLSDDYKNPETHNMAIRRGIGLAITSSFAFAAQALSMAMLGFDDEDDEAVRNMAAPWQRNSNLLYTGRDGNGNIRYMDMSFLDPYNYWKRPVIAVLRNQPANDSLRDILSETLAPFFGTDILAGTIFEVMANKKETGAPVFKSHDDPVNQIVDIANHIRKTIQPGIFNNMERTYKALDGEVTRSGKKYDPQDEAAAWFGFRMSTLDPKVSLFYRSFDFKDAKSEAEKKLRDVALNPNEIGKSELRDTYDEATRIREKAFGDMSRLVNAAMRSGMSRGQVIGTLRNGGISIRDAMSIANGRVPKWQIPQSAGDQARKARSSLGPEAGRRTMERYRELSVMAAQQP